jgi:putative salt-induced outer membrane protein YdiY
VNKNFRPLLCVVATLFVLFFSALNGHGQGQPPAQPPKPWTTEIGAGLAMTNGNSDTKNINLSLGLVRDAKTRSVFRLNGLYLRGDKDGALIINQTVLTGRDEINLSTRTFVFAQGLFLKDTFKNINYLFSPTVGVGYRLINTDNQLLAIDTGVGAVWERDFTRDSFGNRSSLDTKASGAYNAGERFAWKLSNAATVTQTFANLWKTNNWADSLHNFSAGIAASMTQRTQLKLEFLDTYKKKPALGTPKKNDTTLITSLVVKF